MHGNTYSLMKMKNIYMIYCYIQNNKTSRSFAILLVEFYNNCILCLQLYAVWLWRSSSSTTDGHWSWRHFQENPGRGKMLSLCSKWLVVFFNYQCSFDYLNLYFNDLLITADREGKRWASWGHFCFPSYFNCAG